MAGSGDLGISALRLGDLHAPDWSSRLPDGVLLLISRHLGTDGLRNVRLVCKPWRQAFSLAVKTARLEVKEQQADKARAFMQAYTEAFPSTHELVLDVSFRRTSREKIQAAIEAHFHELAGFGIRSLSLLLDLNSFNERKIKLPDMSLLRGWHRLVTLTIQVRGSPVGDEAAACGTSSSSAQGRQLVGAVPCQCMSYAPTCACTGGGRMSATSIGWPIDRQATTSHAAPPGTVSAALRVLRGSLRGPLCRCSL